MRRLKRRGQRRIARRPHYTPCHVNWARQLVRDAAQHEIPCISCMNAHCVACASTRTHWHDRTLRVSACCVSEQAYLHKKALDRAPQTTCLHLCTAQRYAALVTHHGTRVRKAHAPTETLGRRACAWAMRTKAHVRLYTVRPAIHPHTRVSSHRTRPRRARAASLAPQAVRVSRCTAPAAISAERGRPPGGALQPRSDAAPRRESRVA